MKFPCITCKSEMQPEVTGFSCFACGSYLNNYVVLFRLDKREIINRFLNDFLDQTKLDSSNKDFVTVFRLVENDGRRTQYLVSRFMYDFCRYREVDKYVEAMHAQSNRYKLEKDLGLQNFREAHENWCIKHEKAILEKQFDRKFGKLLN